MQSQTPWQIMLVTTIFVCISKKEQKFIIISTIADRKVSGKSKDEQIAEKKQELEKRLQDVSGQLGTNKKQQQKKGQCHADNLSNFQ